MSENKNDFSVLDMAKAYAAENDMEPEDLFKKSPESEEVPESDKPTPKPVDNTEKKKHWTPDASLLNGMEELNSAPLTYSKDEFKDEEPHQLKNIADDEAIRDAKGSMDDMTRKNMNINKAKERYGIKHFQIPEGPFHARIFAAAGDTNHERAQAGLDEIFREIIDLYPEFILDWVDPSFNPANKTKPNVSVTPKLREVPVDGNTGDPDPETSTDNIIEYPSTPTASINSGEPVMDTKIVIDKRQLSDVSWTKEEMDKIRRSRSVELNIIEDATLKYTNIEDADSNTVDVVLSQYVRKVNDVAASLPASNYRATFTGLTYTEILDLSHSQEMNNLDGERKKWSIAFEHTKNPSIGSWKSYDVDENGEKIHITEFDDFLRKTSFMDLEFILWKILCATAMDREIISIDCHGQLNGSPCKKTYDWVYSPDELLVQDSIPVSVLEEMKNTGKAQSIEEIEKQYKESMLVKNNCVELPISKIGVIFGHISAYDYLNSIYTELQNMENQDNVMVSQALVYSTLTILKGFLIPQDNGKTIRIKGAQNLIRIINTLNEVDWQTISELVRIMIEPYQFRFSLRNIVCPQCKTKSDIPIESISRLLFILTSSLSSVQVVLKRT